jgi:hypothetical protein
LWDQLQDLQTVEQMSASLCRQFAAVDAPRAERDVRAALEQLRELSFVESEA